MGYKLPDLPTVNSRNALSSLAEIYTAVEEANRVLAVRSESRNDLQSSFYESRAAGLPERLKEWLEKLYDRLREVVKLLGDAVSTFSITVGTNISVTVEFAGPKG
jgi:hypothetical protein